MNLNLGNFTLNKITLLIVLFNSPPNANDKY